MLSKNDKYKNSSYSTNNIQDNKKNILNELNFSYKNKIDFAKSYNTKIYTYSYNL